MLLFFACSATPPPAPAAEPVVEPVPAKVVPVVPAAPVVKPISTHVPGKRRLVAIGDLHGDRLAALEVLQLAGLTDAEGHWIAGDTTFVQTGDLTDRGPDSKGVIDLLRQVQTEGDAAGGTVHLLNGNHEVMNMMGDWRYVSPGDIEGFGGRLDRLTAFSPTGEYGAFLSSLPLTVKVDDTVFVHGGIHPKMAELGIDGINARAKAHYFDPLDTRDPIHDEEGPTWYRGYARLPESEACPLLDDALQKLKAKRMVVGHTAQRTGEMLVRCGGRFAVIDIGISAHYGHHLGAWEAIDGDARALMPAGAVDIVEPAE